MLVSENLKGLHRGSTDPIKVKNFIRTRVFVDRSFKQNETSSFLKDPFYFCANQSYFQTIRHWPLDIRQHGSKRLHYHHHHHHHHRHHHHQISYRILIRLLWDATYSLHKEAQEQKVTNTLLGILEANENWRRTEGESHQIHVLKYPVCRETPDLVLLGGHLLCHDCCVGIL